MMDVLFSRRSVRRYTADPVEEASWVEMIRAGMYAPSAGDQRPWHFILSRDKSVLEAVPSIHPHAAMVPGAAGVIVVCGLPSAGRHPAMWVQDCSAATQNILLAAESLGLGAVWLGVHPREDRVEGCRRLFGIPEEAFPFAMIACGHPAEKPAFPERFDRARIHFERW